jgi:hypothetical protein
VYKTTIIIYIKQGENMPDIISREHWFNIVIDLIYMRAKQDQNVKWDELEESQKSRLIVEQTRKYLEDRGHYFLGPQPTESISLIEGANRIVDKHLEKMLDNDFNV